jgi:hypothetical protein
MCACDGVKECEYEHVWMRGFHGKCEIWLDRERPLWEYTCSGERKTRVKKGIEMAKYMVVANGFEGEATVENRRWAILDTEANCLIVSGFTLDEVRGAFKALEQAWEATLEPCE